MFGPLAGKVKLNHWLVAVAVISVYSVSAGYKEAPLEKEPESKSESQDRTLSCRTFTTQTSHQEKGSRLDPLLYLARQSVYS